MFSSVQYSVIDTGRGGGGIFETLSHIMRHQLITSPPAWTGGAQQHMMEGTNDGRVMEPHVGDARVDPLRRGPTHTHARHFEEEQRCSIDALMNLSGGSSRGLMLAMLSCGFLYLCPLREEKKLRKFPMQFCDHLSRSESEALGACTH